MDSEAYSDFIRPKRRRPTVPPIQENAIIEAIDEPAEQILEAPVATVDLKGEVEQIKSAMAQVEESVQTQIANMQEQIEATEATSNEWECQVIDNLTQQGKSISNIVTLIGQDTQLLERVERRLQQLYKYTKYIAYRLDHSQEPVLEPDWSLPSTAQKSVGVAVADPARSETMHDGDSQSARSSYKLRQ
jgi:hypothetical protein